MIFMKIIKSWLLPFVIALGVFLISRPVIAQVLTQEEQLQELLASSSVVVDSEVGDNGFRQIYYQVNNNKTFITNTNYTNADPILDGEYVVWTSQKGSTWQIFLHHIPTNQTTQLTHSGNNVNPIIDNGNIVWEGWQSEGWQIFLFDGKSVQQLTFGDISMNADIKGDYIAYARRDVTQTWRAVVYSISRGEGKDVTVGTKAKHPKVRDGKIILTDEPFPLTIEDLFLLDLPPLTTEAETKPEVVTEEEIIEELEATPSATVKEATPSADSREE